MGWHPAHAGRSSKVRDDLRTACRSSPVDAAGALDGFARRSLRYPSEHPCRVRNQNGCTYYPEYSLARPAMSGLLPPEVSEHNRSLTWAYLASIVDRDPQPD